MSPYRSEGNQRRGLPGAFTLPAMVVTTGLLLPGSGYAEVAYARPREYFGTVSWTF